MVYKIKNFRFTRRHLVIVVFLLLFVYGAYSTVNVISRNYGLQRQVDSLTQEVELLKLQNQELEYRNAYFQTDAFVEREARDKLSLQAPGEQVVIFTNKIPSRARIDEELAAKTKPKSLVEESASNFEQWLYFLFRIEPN